MSRASRLLRLFRLMRSLTPLRIMLASVLCSLNSLVWVVALMVFIMLVFAIMFTSSTVEYLISKERNGNLPTTRDIELRDRFGSLLSALLTQYMAITGGMDWGQTAYLLDMISSVWLAAFLFCHFFLFFAFMNVVTGVFCQGALESAAKDTEIVIECQMENAEQYAHDLKSIFKDMDLDGSGSITIDELETHLQNKDVQAYFASMDIDSGDAWTLFSLLDSNDTDEIELEEFIIGCLRLKGSAKSVDMLRLGYESKHMSKLLRDMGKRLQSCEKLIHRMSIWLQCRNVGVGFGPKRLSM